MKRFKDFKIDPILITAHPVHGSHAVPKSKRKSIAPITITAQPVHGKHSIKESKDGITLSKWYDDNQNEHLGKSIFDIHDKLHDENFEESHKRAIEHYTGGSKKINGRLITLAGSKPKWYEPQSGNHSKFQGLTNPKDYEKSPYYHDNPDDNYLKDKLLARHSQNRRHFLSAAVVPTLDKAIATKPLEHDVHVYHGAGFHPGEQASKHPDRLIRLPAYTSTSLKKSQARDFANYKGDRHILHIHLKKGQHARYIAGHSSILNEREMLLPRNTVLKVHKEPTVLSDTGDHIWHAEVHDQ